MKNFRPDLTCKVTIRCSKKSKEDVMAICQKNNIAEAEALRYLLHAGIVLAKTMGIGYVMTIEDEMAKEAKKR